MTTRFIPDFKIQPKILVVDDQEANLFAINSLLKSLKVDVDLVNSGKAAIAKVIRENYALILLDVQMPELDGFDTAEIIKNNANSALTPIIFITAFHNNVESIHRGYESGGSAYLSKPIDAKVLMSKVNLFLDQFREKEKIKLLCEQLNKSNQELSNFAQIASHDLREPLRGIRNNINFFIEDFCADIPDEGKKRLDRTLFLIQKLDNLVASLSTFSQASIMNEAMGEVNLNSLVRDIADSIIYSKENLKIEVTIEPNLPIIHGDRTKIGELFRNLISNGTKYNDHEVIEILVGYNYQKNAFYVEDNGIGISKEHHMTVFDIFKRLHKDDKYGEGTGAGLSICKKIVELHGGTIWIESEEGKGTTFWFTLS